MLLPLGLLVAATLANRPVPDFELRDVHGTPVRLSAAARPTVVAFLDVDCPLAKLYAPRLEELSARFPGVRFLAVNSNDSDELPAMSAFAREHELAFPYLKDPDGRVADLFGAVRSPHAFVLDADRRVRYRGRIDDQYAPGGKNRGKATRDDLAEALREVVAGTPVSIPTTAPVGCLISRSSGPTSPEVTYSRDIAPILAKNCQPCHRPGEVAPFSLLSFTDARDHAATLAEVVENGTMPPWHAAPEFGRFRNERRLSDDQKRLVAEWVRLGCPAGDPSRPAPPPLPATAWGMGTPNAVYRIPVEFPVPAEGIIEYQHFVVDPGFTTDTWVRASEVRPGNRRVVHHCTVFLSPPASAGTDAITETGALGSHNLIAFTPGSSAAQFPDGLAKLVPAGWRLHFVIHYVAIGSPQTDRTELGLQFLEPALVRKEVATKLIFDDDLAIPPHAATHRVERTWTADRNFLLLAMLPHMHLRGKSFRFVAEYPDGSAEVLLDVPAYDFNWQHRYELAEPKRLPVGTVVRCTAVYDNSAGNSSNPDPSATVRTGEQSSDEMFNGYLDVVSADQDLPVERAAAVGRRRLSVAGLGAATLAMVWWSLRLWRGRRIVR